jgi:ATP-binding cassette subfamily F protein 3
VRAEASTALAELDALEGELRATEAEMEALGESGQSIPAALSERYDRAGLRFEQGGGFERHARVAETLAGLGFGDEKADRPLSTFSGGWLMRVELAKLLLAQPDVLLLDEPTNHLDLPSIQFFESTLDRFPGAVLVVSHDRTFLRRQTNRILELDGRGGLHLFEGGYDRYLEQRAERREELLARKVNQDRVIAEHERFVERFRYKATKARQAQSRLKTLSKIDRIELEPEGRRSIQLALSPPARAGERVLALEGIRKTYGNETVYEGVDLTVRRGERVALVGPNGAGKSTLLRIAAGVIEPDAGERRLGHNVQAAFFAQHALESLDADATVLAEVARDAHTEDVPRLRGLLGALLFTGDDVDKRISVLSGGEKARVALAKLLLRPANLLILDEPTNHLDIEACEVLEAAFSEFAGTLLFVSHDRAFLNALATRVVEVMPDQLGDHLGNYDVYLERKARLPEPGETDGVPRSSSPSETATVPPEKEARLRERARRKERDRSARRVVKLEIQIAEHEARKEAVTAQLALPDVYQDPKRIQSVQAEQAEVDALLDAAYAEWERLSESLSDFED